ncbi:ABC transporter substrate-binding protein [Kytococcus schroeteri]|uniref:ABC transporter substrate-binding protein n=1 Tax=Kytococcus schroeteri TaxID=138300 RepID=A0A2I1P915_9MICO|nr:iron-siderophore ABC transporter substrate-binding protein [Kytococcus schroeteri]PKZ41126.1 ABC transporter substrate-binding protein [Kytococcus schroeteri]
MRRSASSVALLATLSLTLTACGGDSEKEASNSSSEAAGSSSPAESSSEAESGGDAAWEPVTVEHAFGSTTVPEEPERVATIDWANQETPLALGISPVGMAKMTWGDDNGDGIQPWTDKALQELGAKAPVLFDETDGYDFEAIAESDPDVILAGYSGMSEEDYATLSKIAPTIAFPDAPWATEWDKAILQNAKGLGQEAEGEELVDELRGEIEKAVAEHPEIKGKSAMFMTHVDLTDLSEINFYAADDTRSKFLEDLGMKIPDSIKKHSEPGKYAGKISTEKADELADVDVIITYGGGELYEALSADPVLSQLPAVKNKAIVALDGESPVGAAANPTALSIPENVPLYVEEISKALAGEGSGAKASGAKASSAK